VTDSQTGPELRARFDSVDGRRSLGSRLSPFGRPAATRQVRSSGPDPRRTVKVDSGVTRRSTDSQTGPELRARFDSVDGRRPPGARLSPSTGPAATRQVPPDGSDPRRTEKPVPGVVRRVTDSQTGSELRARFDSVDGRRSPGARYSPLSRPASVR
jgi:hypothetical protein